jgi:dihydrofolate reductase
MRRVVVWNLMTLDGMFEGPGASLDFMQFAWGPELEAFVNHQASEVGTLLFGHATYEGMAAFWKQQTGFIAEFMRTVPKVVLSRSATITPWENAQVLEGDLGDAVDRLKRIAGKDIFVFGSGALVRQLAERNAVDEYRIGLVSLVQGAGRPLFPVGYPRVPLRLLESRPLGGHLVLLRYIPEASSPTAGR